MHKIQYKLQAQARRNSVDGPLEAAAAMVGAISAQAPEQVDSEAPMHLEGFPHWQPAAMEPGMGIPVPDSHRGSPRRATGGRNRGPAPNYGNKPAQRYQAESYGDSRGSSPGTEHTAEDEMEEPPLPAAEKVRRGFHQGRLGQTRADHNARLSLRRPLFVPYGCCTHALRMCVSLSPLLRSPFAS